MPEAEAMVVVCKERSGEYFMLTDRGTESPTYFISDTSILNLVEKNNRITWQPEGFIRFVSTLLGGEGTEGAEHAFEAMLWSLAETGISLLDEESVAKVLGGVIDQASLNIAEMREMYNETIAEKYGEPLEAVLARLNPIDRPLATIQIQNEIMQNEVVLRAKAEALAKESLRQLKEAQQTLRDLDRFRRKMEKKGERGKRKAVKQKAKSQRRGHK